MTIYHIEETARLGNSHARGERWTALRTRYRRYDNALLGWLTMLAFFVLWELAPALGLVKPLFTSSPSRIFKAALWLAERGLWQDIQVSAQEFGIGLGLAAISGVPLGMLLGWNGRLRAMFNPLISAFHATPRVALLPLLILWLGIGIGSKIAIVFLGSIFPILITVMAGMRTIDENLLKCARSFGANRRQIFLTLALPSTVPFIIAGMRLAVGRALIGVVVGELVASTAGIGHMMSIAGATFQTDKVFVGILILAGAGYSLTELLTWIEAHFERWRPQK